MTQYKVVGYVEVEGKLDEGKMWKRMESEIGVMVLTLDCEEVEEVSR